MILRSSYLLAVLLLAALPSAHAAITFVASGAASHADDADLTPALPTHNTGDLLLCLARHRGGAGVPTASGYDALATISVSAQRMVLFGKIAGASESNPTIDFQTGTAGDTTSAQCAALRGTLNTVTGIVAHSATQTNSVGTQNIAYPALTITTANTAVLVIGGKNNAGHTAVDTLAGMTEIDEPKTTLGFDQGLAWDYVIQTTATNIAAGDFVLTGGGSTVSNAIVISIKEAAAGCSGSPTITDVDSDEIVTATQPNVALTWTNACTSGTVRLRQSGNAKTLSQDSYSDTAGQVDMSGVGMGVASGLLYGAMDICVENSALNEDCQAITVNAPSGTFTRTLSGGLVSLVGDINGSASRLFRDPSIQSNSQVAMRTATGTGCVLGSLTGPIVDGVNEIVVNVDGSIDSKSECTGVDWDFSRDGLYVGTVTTWPLLGVPPAMGGVPITDHVFGNGLAITNYDLDTYFSVGETALTAYAMRQLGTATDTTFDVTPAVTASTRWDTTDVSTAWEDTWVKCDAGGIPVRVKFVNPESNYVDLWEARTCANNAAINTIANNAGSVSGVTVGAGTGLVSGTPNTVATTTSLLHRVTATDGQLAEVLLPFQVSVVTIPNVEDTENLSEATSALSALGIGISSAAVCTNAEAPNEVLTQVNSSALFATNVALTYAIYPCGHKRTFGVGFGIH